MTRISFSPKPGISETEVAVAIAAAIAAGIDAATLGGYDIEDVAGGITLANFQANPGSGDMGNPTKINSGDFAVSVWADTIDQYDDVVFSGVFSIRKFRQYGNVQNVGDGAWKIQYWDGAAWQNWETGIATRITADWGAWVTPAAGVKVTTKVRLVCTTVDTQGNSRIAELEVVG